jgi:polyribonucleotide nucleotidyltransferase
MIIRESVLVGGREITIETGRMAKQAGGAVLMQQGDTVVLVTACAAKEPREGIDFFPLTVEYVEKTFAAGLIPGGFFKREGKLSEREILTCRVIDRPIRPLFPEGFRAETQIVALVLSHDRENTSDVLALTGASTALHLSDIPFFGPIAGVRVGRIDGQFVINPTTSEQEKCDVNIVIAASRDAITMVEGGAKRLPEDVIVEALMFGHQAMQPLLDLQEKLRRSAGKPKRETPPPKLDPALYAAVKEYAAPKILEAMAVSEKQQRYARLDAVKTEVVAALAGKADDPRPFLGRDKELKGAYSELKSEVMRERVLTEGRRIDGRDTTTVRPITSEVSVLPRTHGSALFTRGETQALVATTLGTKDDEQKIDALIGETYKRFMLHYNFPPFSTGETKAMRGPSRREIGHGALAERALVGILPPQDTFPYTIRVVSEVLESNGSSSMASVCAACLSMMDAGVPISEPVAGVAMGLIKEGDRVAILTDILGDEDHLGDMDFKVAGTRDGITAIQMDIKVQGLSRDILQRALAQARTARLHILDKMAEAMREPRKEISPYAPRIITVFIKPDRIRDVIGPGGKTIRGIIEQTGVAIDVEDSGKINIASADENAAKKAIDMIRSLTAEAEVGKIYLGTVRRITDFGAFVEILPGTDGLVHISELSDKRVNKVTDVIQEGDEILVKVVSIDRQGKIRLSRKEAIGEKLSQDQQPPAK